jgi:hypothetical protein
VRRRFRVFKNIIAGVMALLAMGIVGAETYRYSCSPPVAFIPFLWPIYGGSLESDYCSVSWHYQRRFAGMWVYRTVAKWPQAPSVRWEIDRGDFRFRIWKRPIGVEFYMPPLYYLIILLPYPLLVSVRFVKWRRTRLRFQRGFCQSCGYDLTGNESGRCPECGTEVIAI